MATRHGITDGFYMVLETKNDRGASLSWCGSVTAHGNERHLFERRILPFRVGLSIARSKLLQSGFGGQRTLEVFLIDIVKGSRFSKVIEIDRCGDDLIEVQVGFLQIVEKIAHRLTSLVGGFRHVDSTVRPWDETALGRAVEGVTGKNAGTSGRTRRHILWTNRSAA